MNLGLVGLLTVGASAILNSGCMFGTGMRVMGAGMSAQGNKLGPAYMLAGDLANQEEANNRLKNIERNQQGHSDESEGDEEYSRDTEPSVFVGNFSRDLNGDGYINSDTEIVGKGGRFFSGDKVTIYAKNAKEGKVNARLEVLNGREEVVIKKEANVNNEGFLTYGISEGLSEGNYVATWTVDGKYFGSARFVVEGRK